MHVDDLMIGLQVRIYNWSADGEDRPEHWAHDGEMDEWLDCVVTIAEYNEEYGTVWIVEDEGQWEWRNDDFDPTCSLKADDPNLKFAGKKKDDFLKALKARQAREKVKERINPGQYHGITYSHDYGTGFGYTSKSPYCKDAK